MPSINPEQAMMQGMMGMMGGGEQQPPVPPPPTKGQPSSVESASAGGDVILGHLTPGEIVIPLDIISEPLSKKKIDVMFEGAGLDLTQYTVGHKNNNINKETGNPQFGHSSKIRKAKWEAIAKARAAAKQAKADIRRQIRRFKKHMAEEAAKMRQEHKEKVRTMKARTMVTDKGYQEKLSMFAKEEANLGVRPGVEAGGDVGISPEGRSPGMQASSWRRRSRRGARRLEGRPS